MPSRTPSSSLSGSSGSQPMAISSPSMSPSLSESLFNGSVPFIISSLSSTPSSSSSVSALFPIPSISVSMNSLGSRGKASSLSSTPSPSVSGRLGLVFRSNSCPSLSHHRQNRGRMDRFLCKSHRYHLPRHCRRRGLLYHLFHLHLCLYFRWIEWS